MPKTSAKSALLYKFGKRRFPLLILAVACLVLTNCVLSESSGINGGGGTPIVVVTPKFDSISPGTYDNGFAENTGGYMYREQETFSANGSYEFVDYEIPATDTSTITSYTQVTGTWKQQDSTLTLTISHSSYRTTFIGEDNTDSTFSPPDVSPAFRLTGKVTDSSFAVIDTDGQTVNLKKTTKVVFSF